MFSTLENMYFISKMMLEILLFHGQELSFYGGKTFIFCFMVKLTNLKVLILIITDYFHRKKIFSGSVFSRKKSDAAL